jgi:hypothetical protein
MVVVAEGMAEGIDDQGDRDERAADRERHERRRRDLEGELRPTLCYPAVHLNARSGRSIP